MIWWPLDPEMAADPSEVERDFMNISWKLTFKKQAHLKCCNLRVMEVVGSGWLALGLISFLVRVCPHIL